MNSFLKKFAEKKNVLLTMLLFVLIAISSFGILGSTNIISFAEEAEEEEESDDYLCATAVVEKGDELIAEYMNFLNEYFKQNTPTSEQVEYAMNYYRYIKDSLDATYADTMDYRGNRSFNIVSNETSLCSYRRDQYIDYAETIFQAYARYSANSKRTFMLVDGLKAINDDMSGLSMDFHETFPALFNQMDSAMPCFARGCITQ